MKNLRPFSCTHVKHAYEMYLRMGHTHAFSSCAQAPVRDLRHVLVRRDVAHPNIPPRHPTCVDGRARTFRLVVGS